MPTASDPPLEKLLSLIAPRRVLLVGRRCRAHADALDWARARAGVSVSHRPDGTDCLDGDLLICGHAALLPPQPAAAVWALLPTAQAGDVADRGWRVVSSASETYALLGPSGLDWPSGPQLDAYTQARLGVSHQLRAIAGRLAGNDAQQIDAGSTPQAGPPATGTPATGVHPRVSIVVAVHNAPAELRRCIAALSRNTTWPSELLLIDDASSDAEIQEILTQTSEFSGVRVLRNVVNLGFTATVNRALRATRADIVLLNSDTEVGPRWLERLVDTAQSQPGVATVTAVSDNAGAFSVPTVGQPNPLPLALDLASAARLVAQHVPLTVQAPTGSGFCLYITRAAIDAVGTFDEQTFPFGYGEENDFCMRALRAGWTHLVDGRTLVHHVSNASFRTRRAQLAGPARARLDDRYPEYTQLVREFVGAEQMAELRARVNAAYRSAIVPRPRLLFVIQEGGGGTWTANLELMRALETEWDPYALTSDRRTLRLLHLQAGELAPLRTWRLPSRIRVTDFSRDDYREVLRSILREYEFELVHVRHLFKHTFDVPALAKTAGIPVVFSFHDFYFVCPTVNLLDDNDRYCAGECTPGDGECRVPPAGLDGLAHLKHSFVYQWREEVQAMLAHVDAFVTTSPHARAVHLRALPSLSGRKFELIEHGRSLRQRGDIVVPPRPGGQIRILVIANLDVHKGADYIRALRATEHGRRLEFHMLGAVPDAYADLGVNHGTFDSGRLPELAARIEPAFASCLSIAAETHSHSLTEAWAMGVPVLATDLGAQAERIRAHGGGKLLPVEDPAQAARLICVLADDKEAYSRLREGASLRNCATVAGMTDAYAELYREVADSRRTLVAPAGGRAAAQLRGGIRRMLAVIPGSDGVHPGSTYVRVLCRYRHPGVRWKLSLRTRCREDDPVRENTDLVLVQRTALDPTLVGSFLGELRERKIPLVLDLDDHLLLKGSQDADYGPHQESLARLLDAARLVLVSTERLAQALRDRTHQVAVVANMLDERLFLAGVKERPRPRGPVRGRPLQVVYIGSTTHARDLALLRGVFSELDRHAPGRFELNVVGGERPAAGQEWYRRVMVPDDCKPYPQFVHWVRAQRPSWDVAVAPLCDEEFNSYKSDLKYLEYSALGLPAVYSDLEPYATVAHGHTGLKAPTDPQAWMAALIALADDVKQREELAETAFGEVVSRRLLRHASDELLQVICSI